MSGALSADLRSFPGPAPDPITLLAEPATLRDPYPAYERMRAADPVYWSDVLGSWVLTGYDDCVMVLRDTRRFASDWRRVGETIAPPMLSIQTLDPPEHTRVRHLMVAALHTLDLAALNRATAANASRLIALLRGRDHVDFVSEFAASLALDTIVTVLGVRRPDPDWFLPISQAIVDGMDAGLWPQTHAPAVAARARLADLAESWLADPPQGGLVGYLATHGPDSGVAVPVLRNSIRTVLHAGFESAGRLLGNSLAALLSRPRALRRLLEYPAGISRAVEELARFDAPVQADARACVVETSLRGHVIRFGDPVTLLFGAANRDPGRFAAPDTLDLRRAPNPHLSFGRGAHACLGQAVATAQAKVVFTTLAAECRDIHSLAEPVHRRNLTLRGLHRFDIAIS
jgi:cytochrome P450